MARYVDGFVLPLPIENLAAYKEMSTLAGKIWMEHGALSYVECVGDDVKPGKLTSFPQAVKLDEGETVVFSWIVYANKAERDRVAKLVMTDPRMQSMMDAKNCPFDGRRLIYGGFEMLLEM